MMITYFLEIILYSIEFTLLCQHMIPFLLRFSPSPSNNDRYVKLIKAGTRTQLFSMEVVSDFTLSLLLYNLNAHLFAIYYFVAHAIMHIGISTSCYLDRVRLVRTGAGLEFNWFTYLRQFALGFDTMGHVLSVYVLGHLMISSGLSIVMLILSVAVMTMSYQRYYWIMKNVTTQI
jgi:hypothetical protein